MLEITRNEYLILTNLPPGKFMTARELMKKTKLSNDIYKKLDRLIELGLVNRAMDDDINRRAWGVQAKVWIYWRTDDGENELEYTVKPANVRPQRTGGRRSSIEIGNG